MRTIDNGETVSTTVTIKEDVATSHFVTRASKDDPRVEMTVTFDFSNVSHDDLVRLAERSIRIDMQRRYREAKSPERNNPELWERNWDVQSEFVESQRKTMAPAEKVKKAFAS